MARRDFSGILVFPSPTLCPLERHRTLLTVAHILWQFPPRDYALFDLVQPADTWGRKRRSFIGSFAG